MARRTSALTNTQVKQAKPKDKVYKLADGEGLQLRIKTNGSKSWLLDYIKPVTKSRTSISLGVYPEVSLLDARKRKNEAREQLANGVDPKTTRDQERQMLADAQTKTLISVASEWLKIKKQKSLLTTRLIFGAL
ncbi:phage integrase family site specific recombinase [Glaciecola sp. KUL10]|nr:phage integrase family site specific recombinase [Glaciecola sp. KUL10]